MIKIRYNLHTVNVQNSQFLLTKTKKVSISTYFGAEGRTRTGTELPPRDFKSLVSTIPPLRHFSGQRRKGKGA